MAKKKKKNNIVAEVGLDGTITRFGDNKQKKNKNIVAEVGLDGTISKYDIAPVKKANKNNSFSFSIDDAPSSKSLKQQRDDLLDQLNEQANKRTEKRKWWDKEDNLLENIGNVAYKTFLEKDEDKYVKDENYKKYQELKKQYEKTNIAWEDSVTKEKEYKDGAIGGIEKFNDTVLGNFSTGVKGIESTVQKILGQTPDEEETRTNLYEKQSQKARQETTGAGGVALDVVGGVSRMLPQIMVGNPTGATALGFANYGGGAYNEAKNDGYSEDKATKYGIAMGTLEMVTEKTLGAFGDVYGKTKLGKASNEIIDKFIPKIISNKQVRNVLTQFGSEGSEEFLQEYIQNITKDTLLDDKGLLKSTWENVTDTDVFADALYSAFVGGITGSTMAAPGQIDAYRYEKTTGRNAETGLTNNEQAVVDKVKEQRTTELQKEKAVKTEIDKQIKEFESTFGKMTETEKKGIENKIKEQLDNGEIDFTTSKLSKKEIAKIEEQVKEDLNKGNIDIDTIESTLLSEKTTQIKELEEKMNNTSNEQEKAQIQAQISELQNAKASELQSLLSNDAYLQKSYGEANKKKQKFFYETTGYESEYKRQLAKDFEKVANNTTKSHETFEMLSKIAEDKQTNYGVINNEQLKQLGYDIEGKDINGLVRVNEDGTQKVLINIDSDKAINRIIGHETTHLLEGTKEYAKLQKFIKEYATTKGEYDTRLKETTKLYEGIDADIEAEITSDLVGDYLFTDTDFVNNLSVKEPNIFQKIYNEIKHLYKMATAGSKEARQLEKVKKAFDNAYKQNVSNVSEDTKYSIAGVKAMENANDKALTKLYNKAVEMSKEGTSNEEIRQKTRWYKDKNGDWKFEVSDQDFVLKRTLNKNGTYKLGDIVTHDTLFMLYPELKDVNVTFEDIKASGGFSAAKNRIRVNNNKFDLANNYESIKQTLIHEMQHAIQHIEGYEHGTSSKFNKLNYVNNLGEIEATDTANRMTMDYDERLAIAPESSKSNPIHPNREAILNSRSIIEKMRDGVYNFFKGENGNAENNKQNKGSYSEDYTGSDNSMGLGARGQELDNSSFFNTKGDTKYSLSDKGTLQDSKGNDVTLETSDTGTHGTLMAIHNLSSSKLKGILELGGFPVPSIAVMNPSTTDLNYGDISVLFDKNTIDPSNKANEVYGSDVYSPRFPQTVQKVNEKELSKLENYLGKNLYLEDTTLDETVQKNRYTKEFIDKFAKENNITVENVYKDSGFNYTFSTDENVKNFVIENDITFEKLLNDTELRNKFYELYRKSSTGILIGLTERKIETFEKAFADNNIDIGNRLDSDFNSIKNGSEQVLDEFATEKALRDKVLNEYEDQYTKFLTEKLTPIFEDKYIRNSKELFTPSGNRRSFTQLYNEYTLDNVVKEMKGKVRSEEGFFYGAGNIRSQVTPQFKSIADIKANENKLVTNSQMESVKEDIDSDLNNLSVTAKNFGGYSYDSYETALNEIAGLNKITPDKVKNILNDYGFENVPDILIDKSIEFLEKLKNAPTEYFEAKPQRAVGLDEVQAIVIPNNTDASLKQQLIDNGLNVIEYDPYVEGDKQSKINQFDDLKFSLSNQNQDIAPVRGDVFGSDIKLQVEEAIAPLKEEITKLQESLQTTTQQVETNLPTEADSNTENNEYAPLTEADLPMIEKQNEEAFRNIDESNIPMETEENINPEEQVTDTKSLFETRDYAEVGNRKVNAYQYDNPEVKPYFQETAITMLSDLEMSTKGERNIDANVLYESGGEAGIWGTKRNTTPDIAELLEGADGKYKLSYEDIRKGLNAIIEDHGAENIASAKRIEFYLDQRLRNGYTTIDGYEIPANQDYLKAVEQADITNFYNNIPIDESLIPTKQIQTTTENIAPVKEMKVNDSGQGTLDLGIVRKLKAPEGEAKNKDVEPIDLEKSKQLTIDGTEEDLVTKTKKELRKELLIDQNDFFIDALDNAKNRSMALMNNTDTIRNTELVFGRENAKIINEKIFQKEIDNEADSIAWQNQERQEIKDLGIKARSKESAAVQKYGEKQYLNNNGDLVPYTDADLIREFSDVATRNKIKNAAKVIRSKYDNYIDTANNVLTKLGFDPIPKRQDYMRHFQELNDVFSKYGIPFNAQSMTEHVLPTDINGLTENWSPQKNYFANTQHRTGLKTTYDAITGIDGYIGGIANLIYHTEDIQRGRAFEELIRETYGEAKGWDNLENLPDELKQARSEKIQDNHLSNYAAWVHEWTNNVAGKKSKVDRSVESMFGRKAFSFLDNVRKQVGANMIGFNLSSSLTNLIAPVQAAAKTNKLAVLKGTADTIKNMFIKDNFMEQNKFLTSRMGSDMISKNAWQKIQDAGFVFMKGMDWFSSNQIVRSKFYELKAKGMSDAQAHSEAGKFAARVLGDRTKGANAQLYNSKLIGLATQFQLEVNNQLYSTFYDTYHESKENAQNNALKTAAGMTFTLGQLFAFTHLFGQTFEAIAGYNPTMDIVEIIKTALGWGEDDDEEKTTSERLKSAADQLVDSLPYVNILTGGGRIPIASGIPNLVGVATGGKDDYGNELTLEGELKKLLYLVPPAGGNQFKKTTQGLGMFDEDLPVKGSYTDSGNLRFAVEDTPLNRIQAGIFGQYANENASNYFDNERAPLKEKQIQELADLDIPMADYWKYREELKTKKKTEDKFEYISGLDYSDEQKNIMINNAVNRKEEVDISNYDDFGSYEEFNYATKNPEKYEFLQQNNISYENYKNNKTGYNWAYENPDKYEVVKQISPLENYFIYKDNIANIKERYSTDDDLTSKQKTALSKQRKAAVQQYIESLNLSVPQKIMLEKMAGGYSIKSYENYMFQYIESLPMSATEKQQMHKQLFD